MYVYELEYKYTGIQIHKQESLTYQYQERCAIYYAHELLSRKTRTQQYVCVVCPRILKM